MASQVRVKDVFIDVLFLLDKTINFTTEPLVLSGQTFDIEAAGIVNFIPADLVLAGQNFAPTTGVNMTEGSLTLDGELFEIELIPKHIRKMFFHF